MLLVLYYSWIMQAHYRISVFLAKIVFLPLQMIFKMSICKTFSLLLPSHNCIIIHNVQFSRCIWVPYSQETQWNIFCKVFQSISLKWWAKMDSNHRPHDYQSCALASWAIGPYLVDTSSISLASATSCPKLTHCAASPLQIKSSGFDLVPHHFFWWRLAGSNRWPPACKAGALPAELNPHMFFTVCKVHYFLYPLNWITKSS